MARRIVLIWGAIGAVVAALLIVCIAFGVFLGLLFAGQVRAAAPRGAQLTLSVGQWSAGRPGAPLLHAAERPDSTALAGAPPFISRTGEVPGDLEAGYDPSRTGYVANAGSLSPIAVVAGQTTLNPSPATFRPTPPREAGHAVSSPSAAPVLVAVPVQSVAGLASWFRSPIGVSAAGPRLRSALGPGWRRNSVKVCGPIGCTTTVLGDWMRADRLIDLDDDAFVAVCGRLSLGLCRVEVSW